MIDNPSRGCGRKVEGGLYLTSGKGSGGGELSLLTMWYGQHYGRNMSIVDMSGMVIRGQESFAPATTIGEGVLQKFAQEKYISLAKRITSHGLDFALADFVGAKYYTVQSFIDETLEHGISRRIQERELDSYKHHLPFPLVFCQKLPFWSNEETWLKLWNDVIEYDPQAETLYTHDTAVWETMGPGGGFVEEEWGTFSHNYHGQEHRMNAVIRYLDHISKHEDVPALVPFVQADWNIVPFASSWVTRFEYVIHPKDTQEKLETLIDKGVYVDHAEGVTTNDG